ETAALGGDRRRHDRRGLAAGQANREVGTDVEGTGPMAEAHGESGLTGPASIVVVAAVEVEAPLEPGGHGEPGSDAEAGRQGGGDAVVAILRPEGGAAVAVADLEREGGARRHGTCERQPGAAGQGVGGVADSLVSGTVILGPGHRHRQDEPEDPERRARPHHRPPHDSEDSGFAWWAVPAWPGVSAGEGAWSPASPGGLACPARRS